MAKHRRGWKGWVPFLRRTSDPVIADALKARAFATAPTELLPIYSEHLEICLARPTLLDDGQAVHW
ncbi:hypothetical protein [Nocardia tengchongensis]|uniref:hypothetical protein n=1 Tax=Nocardia tengchongensis TaxID=2055889 RepID=UPI0036111E4A